MSDADPASTAEPSILARPDGGAIAYHRTPARESGRHWPGIVFLGGFMSDMTGDKATALEAFAAERGQAFLRFDYRGHGRSSGRFEEGTIGDWSDDARFALDRLTEGPQILVGSSMGGWIMLLTALARPARVAGLIGIAAAPDFTEDSMWAGFSEALKAEMAETGRVALPSDYSDEPYIITRKMIEDGRRQLVLRDPLPLNFPVRLLQGTDDTDVDISVALRLLDHAEGDDIRLTLIKGADHRLSTPDNLRLVRKLIHSIIMKC